MKLNRVLIVIKLHAGDAACADRNAGRALDKMHAAALSAVERSLSAMKIEYGISSREEIPARFKADLIVPVGGDGTFLAAAHAAGNVPLLGVNASPDSSVGFFCAAKASDFTSFIERICEGRIKPLNLPLIETTIDKKAIACMALNDVLFAADSPAEAARYTLKVGDKKETQRSSGIWIAAGPGSTAAINAAGGKAMPIESRRIQYLVREPCPMPGSRYNLTRGILPAGASIEIFSETKRASVYVDGHGHSFRVPRGSTISCRIANQSLSVFL